MFLMLLPMLTNVVLGLVKEYDLLGGDDKDATIDSAGETLDSVILALQKIKNKEPIDLNELKIEKTYDEVLAEIRQSREQVDS